MRPVLQALWHPWRLDRSASEAGHPVLFSLPAKTFGPAPRQPFLLSPRLESAAVASSMVRPALSTQGRSRSARAVRARLRSGHHRQYGAARGQRSGAGEGNRTLVISLEGCCSTIELHPRRKSESPSRLQDRPVPICDVPSTCLFSSFPTSGSSFRHLMVGEVGLEPTKRNAADLQSAPFAARDTPPLIFPNQTNGLHFVRTGRPNVETSPEKLVADRGL